MIQSFTRKDIIKKVAKELDVSIPCATTHVSKAVKEYNLLNGIETATRTVRKLTKKQKALNILRAYPDKDRKEILELFKRELNMTDNSAATHYWIVKKILGE